MTIYTAPSFAKAFKKIIKQQPNLRLKIKSTLRLLEKNPSDPKLNAHKLTSRKTEDWSIRVTYRIRIIFYYHNNSIVLTNVGSHDQVY